MISASAKVVDSWAMLAWLLDQPAAPQVEALLQEADAGNLQLVMSWINAGEVYYIATKRLGQKLAEQFLARLPSLPLRLVVPTEEDIVAAAKIKGAHRVSYADAFAIAQAEQGSVVTGDEEIRQCNLVPVEWIGNQP